MELSVEGLQVEFSNLHVLTYHEHLDEQRTRKDEWLHKDHQKTEEDSDDSLVFLFQPKNAHNFFIIYIYNTHNQLGILLFEADQVGWRSN